MDKDEEMFGGFCKLLNLNEKAGRRYRRNDPVYVYWELIETYMKDELKPGLSLRFEYDSLVKI